MNSPELYASIARAGMTKTEVARTLGISTTSLRRKAVGQSEFLGSEIRTLAACLGLSLTDVNYIFFDASVN